MLVTDTNTNINKYFFNKHQNLLMKTNVFDMFNINPKKTSLNSYYQSTLDTLYETHLDVFNISI